jgi:ABC-type transporter Mla subunit MlaD
VVLTSGKISDSTYVTVQDDPRLGNRTEIRNAQRKMQDRLRQSTNKLVEAMDRLADAEDVMNKLTVQLRDQTGKSADTLRSATKKMQDEIKSIREFISGKPQDKQGYGNVPQITVLNQMQLANQSITSKSIVPGQTEEQLVVRAEGLIQQAIAKVNTFFSTKWADYRTLVQNNPIQLFKDYQPIQ